VKRIAIERIDRSRHQLAMTFSADALRFSTSVWWQDVDLDLLAQQHGDALVDKICFHIAAFELNKLVSLRPEVVDLGPGARFHTRAFETLWRTVVHKVWAQWRWEHDWPDYAGPAFASAPVDDAVGRATVPAGPVPSLAFCGGGKDSLVAMKLLERAGEPFASFAYAHSVYGAAAPQHALIDGLLDHGAPVRRHRQWVHDDFLDSPVLALHPELGCKRLLAAETPSSLFAVLPLVLAHGYRQIVLAHERSANVGNLVWDKTGEDVNHQWGKSREAEQLLDAYLAEELLDGVRYFSLLQPIHDLVIFHLLSRDLEAVPATHSCNVRKPWCGRCAKCAYVWLGYQAFLPPGLVHDMFGGVNLFDVEENQRWFSEMLGLGAHTPFECIGQIDEARLAFARCRDRGLTGRAMSLFTSRVRRLDRAAIAARYCTVDASAPIPPALAARVLPALEAAAAEALEKTSRPSERTG
jgi:UDP-N-acetyl-alpha-D-muramoyl-L-alanyl-L-glutamate epimerase